MTIAFLTAFLQMVMSLGEFGPLWMCHHATISN